MPKGSGGTDNLENLQLLCEPCHRDKCKTESYRGNLGPLLRPRISRPGVPVTLVCGCAGSGKSSYVAQHASAEDVVIDLDVIRAEMTGEAIHQTTRDTATLAAALQRRNEILESLAQRRTGRAWFIVGAPKLSERRYWREMLGASVVVLETPVVEAVFRMARDETRAGRVADMREWAADWWRAYVADPADQIVRA